MQRGTAALFLLIGLLIVGLIGIFFIFFLKNSPGKVSILSSSPLPPIIRADPKPVSDLPTYTNQKLGFKFQYPSSVTVKEDTEEDFNKRGNGNFRKNFTGYVGYEPGKFVGAVAVLEADQSIDLAPLSIWVFDNPENLDTSAWFEKYWYYPFLWGVFSERDKGHVRAEKIATISGQTTKYAIVSYQTGAPKYLYLSNKGKMYLLRIIGEVGDNILSSFKFSQ